MARTLATGRGYRLESLASQYCRYHRGTDLFPVEQAWTALYTSLAPEVAIWEMVRRSTSRNMQFLKNTVISELKIELDRGLNLTASASSDSLTGPHIQVCRDLGALTKSHGYQGMLVPSAALDGTNLVIIPDNLPNRTTLQVIDSSDLPIDF